MDDLKRAVQFLLQDKILEYGGMVGMGDEKTLPLEKGEEVSQEEKRKIAERLLEALK